MHHRLLDRGLSHRQSAVTLVAISFTFALFGILSLRGGLWLASAMVLAILEAAYLVRAFGYDEFPLFATVTRKILDHRYTADAHLQLREVAAVLEKTPPESLGELRNLISKLLGGLGFAEAILIVPELDRQERTCASRGVLLEFPLSAHFELVGRLRLRWDLGCAIPIDLSLFVSEFLPVLTRSVQWYVQAHREATRPLTFSVRNLQRPRLVPSLREVDATQMTSLQN
jgi:hypothetical protein